jgi:thiamine-monophosphate kinase
MGGASQHDEFDIIAKYFAPLSRGSTAFGGESFGLTDDAALLDVPAGQQLVMTKDMLVAGVHFFADDAPDIIARKLLRVNLSDLAAMGAVPLGYLLGFGIIRDTDEAWIKGFTAGLARDQQAFNITLLGGDSVAAPHDMTFSLTAFGTVPSGQALTRSGAQAGDTLYVTGTIGDAALGLAALQGELEEAGAELIGRYHLPQPRLAIGARVRGVAHAALDVSDGLLADLGHMAQASGLAMHIEASRVPLSAAARGAVEKDARWLETAITGGDDYELVFAAPPEAEADIKNIASETGGNITPIGYCAKGEGVEITGPDGRALDFAQTGYNHFR